jgi:hypothetical protein
MYALLRWNYQRMAEKTPTVEDLAELAVTENVKWLDKVVWVFCGGAGVVLLLKIVGRTKFKMWDVELDLNQAWVVFTILTIAHLYTTVLLVRSLKDYWAVVDVERRRRLYRTITSTGNLFVRGIVARTKYKRSYALFVRFEMDPMDPTSWLAVIGISLLVIAAVPFEWRWSTLGYIAGAMLLGQVNWGIGSNWVVALCDLSNRSGKSAYFKIIKQGGVSFIRLDSGGFAFADVPWALLPVVYLLSTLIALIALPFRAFFFGRAVWWYVQNLFTAEIPRRRKEPEQEASEVGTTEDEEGD